VSVLKTAVGAAAIAGTLLTLPLLAIGRAGQPGLDPTDCGQVTVILDTIRTLESAGHYQAQSPTSSASGAYQYVDDTWRHWAHTLAVDIDRYPSAWTAPPEVQDRVAAANVNAILTDHHRVEAVPVAWYYPAALDDPTLLDAVPVPSAGNTLTVRQYQTRWLDIYRHNLSESGPDTPACAATVVDGNWALPVPANRVDDDKLAAPHHDYPAWDLPLPEGTPIHAITGGDVAATQHWDGNWWRDGCDTTNQPAACNTCGNGITIQTSHGLRHTYCHNRTLHVAVGDHVVAGQHIADSGDTGRSGTPHLHLELRVDGTQRCPQPLLTAIYHHQPVPDPDRLPTAGCTS
jgi:murein DD-endopeptidase MepM/ murein hydrolase activator NlpD